MVEIPITKIDQITSELYHEIQLRLEQERKLDEADSQLYSELKDKQRIAENRYRKNRRGYQKLITRYIQSLGEDEKTKKRKEVET
jgi:hypothetical protein